MGIDVDPVELRKHSNTISAISSEVGNVGAAAGYHQLSKGLPALFRGADRMVDELSESLTKLIKNLSTTISHTSTAVYTASENYVDADEKSRRTIAPTKELNLPL